MQERVFFPSCNFTAASPEAAEWIQKYLSHHMSVAECCRTDKTDYSGKTAVYFCQACREVLEAEKPDVAAENLFVYLAEEENFPWQDYSGLTVNVQDCWRDREHPEIFDAVRSCLEKMRIKVLELSENRENSRFCGNLHFEPRKPENIALLEKFPGTPIFRLPPEAEQALMREQVEQYTAPLTVCYCNRCVSGVKTGGGNAVHLLELAAGTYRA